MPQKRGMQAPIKLLLGLPCSRPVENCMSQIDLKTIHRDRKVILKSFGVLCHLRHFKLAFRRIRPSDHL